MKITLYTNRFVHDGQTHVSAMVMVMRGDLDIVGSFSTSAYATLGNRFECAFQTITTAQSVKRLLEDLGNEVEIEPMLTSIEALSERLGEEVLK